MKTPQGFLKKNTGFTQKKYIVIMNINELIHEG